MPKEEIMSQEDCSATALISLRKKDKVRYTKIAKQHGLSLSAFLRLAAEEYVDNHGWNKEESL